MDKVTRLDIDSSNFLSKPHLLVWCSTGQPAPSSEHTLYQTILCSGRIKTIVSDSEVECGWGHRWGPTRGAPWVRTTDGKFLPVQFQPRGYGSLRLWSWHSDNEYDTHYPSLRVNCRETWQCGIQARTLQWEWIDHMPAPLGSHHVLCPWEDDSLSVVWSSPSVYLILYS